MTFFRRSIDVNVEDATLSPEDFEIAKCSHCGGAHLRACPRVKRMVFNGEQLVEVEFWEVFNDEHVIWPEDVYDAQSDEVG